MARLRVGWWDTAVGCAMTYPPVLLGKVAGEFLGVHLRVGGHVRYDAGVRVDIDMHAGHEMTLGRRTGVPQPLPALPHTHAP